MQNLKALLERLLENQIDFVLVGGFASVVHGSTLVTQDLDIMSEMPPVGDFAIIKNSALEVSLYGHPCKVIALDDLIRIKQSMTRPKDQEALRQLLKIKDLKK